MTTPRNTVKPFPRVLRIEPASQCNLACSHCPTGTVDMTRGVMAEKVFEKVLSEIALHKGLIKVIVLYHGGEPLLNRNFYSMVARIKEIDSSIYIKTVSNGMALTKKHAQDILDSGLDLIEFSLDGESPEESQHVRVSSNTQRIIKNINEFIALKNKRNAQKPEIYIATTQFLRDRNLNEDPGEPDVPLWLEEAFKNQASGYKPTYAMKWPHMRNSGNFDYFKPVDGPDSDDCDHVINTITVRADGTIAPCCFDLTSKLIMGNILDDALIDIWNGQKYTMLRESIQSKQYISICNTCAVVRPKVYLIPRWHADNLIVSDVRSAAAG